MNGTEISGYYFFCIYLFVSGVLVQVDPPGGIGSAVLGCSRYARVLKLSILARIEHFFVNFAPLGSVSIERV